MSIDAFTALKTVEELEKLLREQQEQMGRYRLRVQELEEQVRLLKKALFGPRSEKSPPPEEDGPQQLRLFNEAEVLTAQEEQKPSESVTVPEHTRQKPRRKPLPPELPRVEVIHDIPEEQKVCACGSPLVCIGREVSEKLDYIPAKIQVIQDVRLKYACKSCEGVESEGPTVQIAPAPPQIIPKGLASPGLLAHIAVSKYADALPLYRQEKIFERHGIDISRSTMAGWMVRAADACEPVMELLRQLLLTGPLVNVDETPVQVLKEPGRADTTKSYMWVFRGGDPAKPVVFFRYAPTRSADVPLEVLQGYRGYCQTDGFSGYERLEALAPGIIMVGCFSHARRNFIKVIDARGKEAKKKPGSAEVAVECIRKLYSIEDAVRGMDLPEAEMCALRRERAGPVLEAFKNWMGERAGQTPPKGLLGKALSYALDRWDKLVRYLENIHITPDNNWVENAIRPFALGRKNWLFAGHPNGARAAATLYSLIETAKVCGLEPYRYLRYLFEKLPYARCEEDYRALLPQNLTPELLAQFVTTV